MRSNLALAIAGLLLLAFGTIGSVRGVSAASCSPSAGLDAHVDASLATEETYEGILILVVRDCAKTFVAQTLRAQGYEVHRYDHLPMVAVRASASEAPRIAAIPGVAGVWPNEPNRAYLDQAAPYVGAPTVWNTFGHDGDGATIMIIDSGVDGTHPDVRLGENLIQNVRPAPVLSNQLGGASENQPLTDFDGHGTHVASIAGGTAKAAPNPGKYRGLAHGANLVGYAAGTIDSNTGDTTFQSANVLAAFDYTMANQKKYGIRVVSNSWGANGEFDAQSPVNIASLQLYKSGLVVVFAAGNEGDQGQHTLNKYSVAPWVLGVGAGDYLNRVASFSSRGTDPAVSGLPYDHPDVVAPGVGIIAAKAKASSATETLRGLNTNLGEYVRKSGTSMATPVVAGIAALLIDANPRLSPDEVMDAIVGSAVPLSGYAVWEAGAGFVNALDALRQADRMSGSLDEFLSGLVKYGGAETGDKELANDPVTLGPGRGEARQVSSGTLTLDEFAAGLTSTTQGLVFLVGTLLLGIAAFRVGR